MTKRRPLVSFRLIAVVALGATVLPACDPDTGTPPDEGAYHSVTVSAQPAEGGAVSGAGSYPAGALRTVTASANPGFRFLQWTEAGQTLTAQESYTFTVLRDRELSAEFQAEVAVSGGGTVPAGDSVNLSAISEPGYVFLGWSIDDQLVSVDPIYTFVASVPLEVVADFGVDTVRGVWSPGGTYSDWYFAENALTSLEWTFVPVTDPPASLAAKGLLHYYAYTFAVTSATPDLGGGYAGFQTNGIIFGLQRGKVINFSIWGSNGGKSGGWVNPANTESGGWQIMYPYEWNVGVQYRFELTMGPSGVDSQGKWWGLWVTDGSNGARTFVGEQRVPTVIGGKDATHMQGHTAMFGEDLHWWHTLNGARDYHCGEFEPSAMAAIDISANGGALKPDNFTFFRNAGQPVTGSNGHKTTTCAVTVYDLGSQGIQHNLGFWEEPAPSYR